MYSQHVQQVSLDNFLMVFASATVTLFVCLDILLSLRLFRRLSTLAYLAACCNHRIVTVR